MEPYAPQTRLPQLRNDDRVGDLERGQVCDHLSAAFAAGRLDRDELEERISRAVSARTRMDLHVLVYDLGAPAVARPEPRPVRAAAWNGPDVLAVILLAGCSAIVLAMLLVIAGVSPPYFLASVVGGALAFVAGASATQLVHRSVRRTRDSLRAGRGDAH